MKNVAKISILIDTFKKERASLEHIFSRIYSHSATDEETTVYLAYQIHNYYSCFEELAKGVAKAFENNIEDFSKYHKELIYRMRLDLLGFRPALISENTAMLLDEILKFRHRFRHAYNYQLNPAKVNEQRQNVLALAFFLNADLDKFESFLLENLAV